MSEDIDHLKAFERASRENLSTNYVDLFGLADLRAHIRADKTGEPVAQPKPSKQAKREFTPEQIRDMETSTDPLTVIANRVGTSHQTVSTYRRKARNR